MFEKYLVENTCIVIWNPVKVTMQESKNAHSEMI